jgi:AraC-like DNA-binding protein
VARLAGARPLADLLLRPLTIQVEGFGVDFVSWGHYRPSVWRNYWHSHSFYEVCLGYAGTGTFRVGQTVHGVGPGALFVARPGQVHEIDSTSTDPFGIVFWGFTLRPVARSARLEERGWWSALVDETRPSVSIRVGAIPELVDALAAEAGSPRAGVDSMITSLVTALTVETCRAFAEPSTLVVTQLPVTDRGSADVAVMLRYLNDNLSRPVEVRDVAAQVHISERQAQRIFRAATGESLMSALRRLRLEQAAALLLETRIPIQEVARRCGYTDQRAFVTAFGRHYRQTATAFRATKGTIHLGFPPRPRTGS